MSHTHTKNKQTKTRFQVESAVIVLTGYPFETGLLSSRGQACTAPLWVFGKASSPQPSSSSVMYCRSKLGKLGFKLKAQLTLFTIKVWKPGVLSIPRVSLHRYPPRIHPRAAIRVVCRVRQVQVEWDKGAIPMYFEPFHVGFVHACRLSRQRKKAVCWKGFFFSLSFLSFLFLSFFFFFFFFFFNFLKN